MSGLSEAEVVTLADWESDTFGDTLDEAPFDALVTVVERIVAARVASAAAENAALRARIEALADSWEAKGRDWHWNSASRNVWLTTAHDLRAVVAAAHDEGSDAPEGRKSL